MYLPYAKSCRKSPGTDIRGSQPGSGTEFHVILQADGLISCSIKMNAERSYYQDCKQKEQSRL